MVYTPTTPIASRLRVTRCEGAALPDKSDTRQSLQPRPLVGYAFWERYNSYPACLLPSFSVSLVTRMCFLCRRVVDAKLIVAIKLVWLVKVSGATRQTFSAAQHLFYLEVFKLGLEIVTAPARLERVRRPRDAEAVDFLYTELKGRNSSALAREARSHLEVCCKAVSDCRYPLKRQAWRKSLNSTILTGLIFKPKSIAETVTRRDTLSALDPGCWGWHGGDLLASTATEARGPVESAATDRRES
ncbi:hypothetical protein RRG08_046969 [Elysia crispata]|uniref:Uncharacterized protein n=1 Tax=Elysia crispata TaxID=231223 RepID=A0AAE1A8Y1_9GAST|nr:hypothetical protein RRG08_046969 [Elysia crispata]